MNKTDTGFIKEPFFIMSKKNKLKKFAEISAFPHVYENFDHSNPALYGKDGVKVALKGQWNAVHFKNDQPITLELACGRGEYTIGMARMHPNRNFIGIDIKGARIWQGAKISLDEGLSNVAFARTRIEYLPCFFAPEEISQIWITFPDPFLKSGKENRRLTSPRFLKDYRQILIKDHLIHLKTDSPELYQFTMDTMEAEGDKVEVLYHDDNIYTKALPMSELELKTYYERQHLAAKKTIKYVRFKLV